MIKFWTPIVLWAGVIFAFSSQQAQPALDFSLENFIIRKSAHVTEYAILFLLFYRAFLNTTKLSRKRCAFFSLLFVIIYGASDEFHQFFTPGRTARVRDVVIDGFGGFVAWVGLWKLLPKAPAKLKNLAETLQVN